MSHKHIQYCAHYKSEGAFKGNTAVEAAFCAVDRAHFLPAEFAEKAYENQPLRTTDGVYHLSAPNIYISALTDLELERGHSFLNIGSGSGYFSAMVAQIIGPDAHHVGLEVDDRAVSSAMAKCQAIGLARVQFVHASAFQLNLAESARFDRIYVGAAASMGDSARWVELLKPNGLMLGPFHEDSDASKQIMQKVRRLDEYRTSRTNQMGVSFRALARDSSRQPPGMVVLPHDAKARGKTGAGSETEAPLSDAHGLTKWLLARHSAQLEGGATKEPCTALLTAGPASGKTTLLSQVVTLALNGERTELVPILVKVQNLQRRLLEAPDAFTTAWNYIDAFLRLEHEASHPALYRMLRQAMMARRALLLLDGLDEAGAKRAEIERHVVDVLAPQGHVLLCTSRPAGIDEERFAAFRRFTLAPLTDAQQERALKQRLGAERSAALLLYVRSNVPRDDKGQKVTSNPLMLSMVASVYELRQDLGMPATVAELYETASNAMLARGGVTTPALMQLLQRIFFEAHVAQRRLIEDCQLDVAALGLEAPEALAKIRTEAAAMPFELFGGRAEKGHYVEVTNTGGHNGKRGVITTDDKSGYRYKVTFAEGTVSGWLEPNELRSSGLDEMACFQHAMARSSAAVRTACDGYLSKAMCKALGTVHERVLMDALPLLSLLQSEPLQLQSSHLSFQEYFAARALCEEGTKLSGTPPWQWPGWWANAVELGAEMGDSFGRGLLRAAGVTGDTLDLSQKLGGDRPTVRRVVAALIASDSELKTVLAPAPANLFSHLIESHCYGRLSWSHFQTVRHALFLCAGPPKPERTRRSRCSGASPCSG